MRSVAHTFQIECSQHNKLTVKENDYYDEGKISCTGK